MVSISRLQRLVEAQVATLRRKPINATKHSDFYSYMNNRLTRPQKGPYNNEERVTYTLLRMELYNSQGIG